MPSEKSDRPQDTEEEITESGGSPPTEESDMNVDSPAPPEEASGSGRTGESMLSEEVSASPGSARSDLKDAGSLVTAEGPTDEAASSGSSASKSIFDCMKVTGRKPSPSKGDSASSSQEAFPKTTKGKSCTPKKEEKSPKKQASPGTTLSPKAKSEEGEATGSPMKSGKLGFFQRIISPNKGNQRSTRGREDSEQAEDAPLTAVASPKGSGKPKKGLLGFFVRKSSETKEAAEIPPGKKGGLVEKCEIPSTEDASDSTDTTNLSPSSSSSGPKGAGPESGFFDTPQLDQEGQKTSAEESSKSTPGSVEETSSSGAVSCELADDQPEATADETTDEKPPSKPATDGETQD